MGMEQLGGLRVLIDRLGLPPRIARIVKDIEEHRGPLEQVGGTPGADEIRKLLHMVDGQMLCCAIVATLANEVELTEEEAKADRPEREPTLFERWSAAEEAFPDSLVLLRDGDKYVTFDAQAERIAGEIDEHHSIIDGHMCLSLLEGRQPQWAFKIQDKGLDVVLADESHDDDGTGRFTFVPVADLVTDGGEAEPVIEPE